MVIPQVTSKDRELKIDIETTDTDSILYFLSNGKGKMYSQTIKVNSSKTEIIIPEQQRKDLEIGANELKIFAVSQKVLKPDYYVTSFLVTENNTELPQVNQEGVKFDQYDVKEMIWILAIVIVIISIFVIIRKTTTKSTHNP